MVITKGSKLVNIDSLQLEKNISGHEKVFLDIGAGSGKFIYRMAKNHPEDYFIGLETSHDSVLDYARRIEKKPSRGGLSNIIYVIGSIESPPVELRGIADEIFINYPWTKLLKALVIGEENVLSRISSLFLDKGVLNTTLCYDKRYEPRFVSEHDLPDLSEEYIRTKMARSYKAQGFELESVDALSVDEMKDGMSRWGKKLAFSRDRTAWRIRFVRRS
jgi:16S rRNA (adenine(1408)-N(1))-methyltransferase